MMINIRCWSCGKPIAHMYDEYLERTKNGEEKAKVLDNLGMKRYCCRASFIGHVDLIDNSAPFKQS